MASSKDSRRENSAPMSSFVLAQPKSSSTDNLKRYATLVKTDVGKDMLVVTFARYGSHALRVAGINSLLRTAPTCVAWLAATDAYEVSDYRRETAKLRSGRQAWVYVL